MALGWLRQYFLCRQVTLPKDLSFFNLETNKILKPPISQVLGDACADVR